MAQHGGYREPANPAPVSGPGKLSRRTDGGPTQPARRIPSAAYGEGVATDAIQAAAPLAAAENPTGEPEPLVGFDHPTAAPDEPVTAGAPFGPGPGTEAIPPAAVGNDVAAVILRAAYAAHPSPQIASLITYLEQDRR